MASTLRRLSAALCVPLALALAGCMTQYQTSQPYTPAEGVNQQAGSVKVRNLMVIADATGQGVISASLVTYADDALTGIAGVPHKSDNSLGSALVVTATGLPLTMPANTLFILTNAPLRVAVTSPDLAGPAERRDPDVREGRPGEAGRPGAVVVRSRVQGHHRR